MALFSRRDGTPVPDRPGQGSAVDRLADRLAAGMPPLLVEAERIAATIAPGTHGRRRVGPGESFWQFRHYLAGDPVQRIDWRQTAKRDHVAIRELEWEAAQTVHLWRDGSASMAFSSHADLPSKRDRAGALTLALATLLARAGERVALLGGDGAPTAGRARLADLARRLDRLDEGDGLPPEGPSVPRHSALVLIGDFLVPPETLTRRLGQLADSGVDGHLMLLLDPAEIDLPYRGRVRFDGAEREGSLLVPRVEAIRAAYREKLADHIGRLESLCRAVGWRFHRHSTDRPPETALLALYQSLAPRAGGLAQ